MLPETLILRPSRGNLGGLVATSAVFTLIGIFLIVHPDTHTHPRRGGARLIENVLGPSGVGWFSTIFFGACTLVFLIQLLAKATFLELSSDGFLSHTVLRKDFTRWQDVRNFGVCSSPGTIRFVGFNYAEGRPCSRVTKARRRFSTYLNGFEAVLPYTPRTLGMTAEKLADLMTERLNLSRP
jgi:hypothetical protein